MSTLQVANLHFEATGNNRIQFTGNNTFTFVAAGANLFSVNTSTVTISGSQSYTINALSVSTNVATIGTGSYFVANGNVGIGTNSPVTLLDVAGTIRSTTASPFFELVSGSTSTGGIYSGDTTSVNLLARSGKSLVFMSGGTVERARLDASGNLLIGTQSAAGRLTVSDSTGNNGGQLAVFNQTTASGTNYAALFQATGTSSYNTGVYVTVQNATGANYGIRIVNPQANTNNWAIYSDATAQSYFAGNVGIGTGTPTSKLHVIGSIKGGGLTLNDSAITAGTSQTTIDYLASTGRSRVLAWGANTSSAGTLSLGVCSSDASVYADALLIDRNGYLIHNTVSYLSNKLTSLGSPNLGTYKGYILLAKAYVSGLQDKSIVSGRITIVRGSTGSGERTDMYDVVSSSGYNAESFSVRCLTGAGQSFFVRTVKVTYSGTVYHAIETTQTGGQPDNGVWFQGIAYNYGSGLLYVDATYVSSISAYGYADGVNFNGDESLTLQNGRIKFPATQNSSADANTLDDYEEGTWTPVFTTDSTAPTGVSYSSRYGTYTKIGNVVSFRCTIQLSSKGTGGTGNVIISGMPFAAAGLAGGYAYQPINAWFYPQSGDTFTNLYASLYDSASYIFVGNTPKATDMTPWSSFGNSSKISFSGTYVT